MRTLTATLATAALIVVTAASAADWKPATSKTIDLGGYRGTAYYTAETDEFRVAATIAAVNSHSGQPQIVRLSTTLKGNQTVNLSIPGSLGADGKVATIAFKRPGEIVEVAAAE